jgi:FkbM family methyltransferase
MWNLISRLDKPEYLFRPSQIARRVCGQLFAPRPGSLIRLPWRLAIKVSDFEIIGRAVRHAGVFELVVSETLWRLLEPGDVAGANVGYMTCLMAARVGATGAVYAFEPHPGIVAELGGNVERWNASECCGEITIHNVALSDCRGPANMFIPSEFAFNHGVASLAAQAGSTAAIQVECARLDDFDFGGRKIALLKADVERHEFQLLKGAGRLLAEQRIRDVIFEDHNAHPSQAMRLLHDCGYSLFALGQTVLRPLLTSPETCVGLKPWESHNYLATLEPDRALQRFERRGWMCLQGRTDKIVCRRQTHAPR